MKTAISIPDETYERAERQAEALGMSRSEFFTRAAQRFLDQLEEESLATRIDAAIELISGTGDDSAELAVHAGRRLLASTEDDW